MNTIAAGTRVMTPATVTPMIEGDGRGARNPSMADVAHEAGVSAQTVSRTLRGSPQVTAETRRRVLAAVDRLGYRMNTAARTLSSGRSRTIGLVLLQSGGFYSRSAVTAGVETAAEAAGFAVTIATIGALDPGQLERALIKLADQGVEGLVIAVPLKWATPRMEEITRDIPTVTIDGSRMNSAATVGLDQRAGGRIATEHLLALGHRQVWHVSGPLEWLEASQRQLGWQDALAAAGVTDPPPVLEGDWTPESGLRQGRVLARIPDVTAVFVASDEMAFGVVRAFAEAGRAVPGDVSLVSVDDIALAAYGTPPLTTVRQNLDRVGATAVGLLLGDERAVRDEPDPPELIVRASTAPPPAG